MCRICTWKKYIHFNFNKDVLFFQHKVCVMVIWNFPFLRRFWLRGYIITIYNFLFCICSSARKLVIWPGNTLLCEGDIGQLVVSGFVIEIFSACFWGKITGLVFIDTVRGRRGQRSTSGTSAASFLFFKRRVVTDPEGSL